MANFVITQGSNSFEIEIDGKKARFESGDVKPYTPDGAGNRVYLYDTVGIFKAQGFKILDMPRMSGDRIPMIIGTDTIDVGGITSFADADALMNALEAVFFLASVSGNPLIPTDQRVNTFADLPNATLSDGEYWAVDQATGVWILGTRRDAGIYKAVAGAWVYRGADVPYYLLDDNFTIKDSADNSKQIGFEVGLISTGQRRIATFPDKDIEVGDAAIVVQGQNSISGGGDLRADRDLELVNDELNPLTSFLYGINPAGLKGWHALTDLVANNAGQIKLNWATIDRPESPVGFTTAIPQQIPLNSSYAVSGSPTTVYPYLANPLNGGDNLIDPSTLYLRELLAGQSIKFRVNIAYTGFGGGFSFGTLVVRMYNPNPGSSFSITKSVPVFFGVPDFETSVDFIAIADGLSLDPLYGYAFEVESSITDPNLQVFIEEITAFYNGVELFNKT